MKKNVENLTQDYVKSLFDYNKDNGYLYWKTPKVSWVTVGDRAGSYHKGTRYRRLKINNNSYLEHRIIWLYVYGYYPEYDIDHINRIRDDNRLSNLREVSRSCNIKNSIIRIDNKSGITGIHYNKIKKTFKVQIVDNNNKRLNLGRYKNFNDAVVVRWKAEVKYRYPDCNTTSTAYNYLKKKGLL